MKNSSKAFKTALLITLLILSICLSISCNDQAEKIVISIVGKEFIIEVARTTEAHATGLMNRKDIGSRQGMIFVYPRDTRLGFWMKNTEIPLSLAFLDVDGQIVQIEDLEPFDTQAVLSKRSVRYALEVKQGIFDEIGVVVGDRVLFPDNFP